MVDDMMPKVDDNFIPYMFNGIYLHVEIAFTTGMAIQTMYRFLVLQKWFAQ